VRTPRRLITLAAAAVLVAGISGCSSSPRASSSAGTGTGGLAPLSLANVTTETAAARGSTIGSAGGTISATGGNGAVYTLVLPAGAVDADTAIALYPVTSLASPPKGASVKAGVQLSPDGLTLRAPATLTIGLPAGTDAAKQGALAWAGDAVDVHRYPSITTGTTVAMTIVHFSGYADTELFNDTVDATAANARYEDLLVLHWQIRHSKNELRDDLREWYQAVVKPAFERGAFAAFDQPLDVKKSDVPYQEYSDWLLALDWARQVTGDPTFTVAPELADSVRRAVNVLGDWYFAENAECVKRADDINTAGPLFWATLAIHDAATRAKSYSDMSGIDFATVANKLDRQSLLDGLCVKVVIDPSRSYSAKKPGDTGTVALKAGFKIGNGAVRYGVPAYPIWVAVKVESGAQMPVQKLGDDGRGTVDGVVWPPGTDPVQIDLEARLVEGVDAGTETEIVGLDRITKSTHEPKIVFRSDRDGGTIPQLWSMNPDGTDAKQLTHDPVGFSSLNPAWSPDGTKIAFVHTGGGPRAQIWVMDANGENAHPVTHFDAASTFPTWSRDGSQIAFSSDSGDADGRYRIFIIDADGNNERPLTEPPSGGGDIFPRWSPDGSKIVFESVHRVGLNGQQIYFLNVSQPDIVTPLTSGGEGTTSANPNWSPDGTRIVFVSQSFITLMSADGTDVFPIFKLPPGAYPNPVWSGDGTRIAFDIPWTNNPSKHGIFTIDLTGGDLKALSPADANETNPDWTR